MADLTFSRFYPLKGAPPQDPTSAILCICHTGPHLRPKGGCRPGLGPSYLGEPKAACGGQGGGGSGSFPLGGWFRGFRGVHDLKPPSLIHLCQSSEGSDWQTYSLASRQIYNLLVGKSKYSNLFSASVHTGRSEIWKAFVGKRVDMAFRENNKGEVGKKGEYLIS